MVLSNSGLDIEREEAARVLDEKFVSADGEVRRQLILNAPSTEPMDVLERTIARLETVLRPANPGDGVRYPYIPAPYRDYLDGMAVLGPANGRSLLEVGCGIGTKAVMAWKMGWTVYGIDVFQPYLDVAAEVCPVMKTELIDAHDFDRYSDFDAVYCYVPLIEVRAAARLVQTITERMRPGAHLFAYAWLIEVPNAKRLGDSYVWQIGDN